MKKIQILISKIIKSVMFSFPDFYYFWRDEKREVDKNCAEYVTMLNPVTFNTTLINSEFTQNNQMFCSIIPSRFISENLPEVATFFCKNWNSSLEKFFRNYQHRQSKLKQIFFWFSFIYKQFNADSKYIHFVYSSICEKYLLLWFQIRIS